MGLRPHFYQSSSATDPTHGQSVPLARLPVAGQKRHLPPFWRHFLEMLAPVSVGMLATGAIFLSIVGSKTWDQVTVQYPPGPAGDGGRDDHPSGGLDALPGNGTPERPRDRGGNGPPPGPVLCLVWFDITGAHVRSLLLDDCGDAGAGGNALPPQVPTQWRCKPTAGGCDSLCVCLRGDVTDR